MYKAIFNNGQLVAMKKLGWGEGWVMHYMIMDSKLNYNYELKNFLHVHSHI
jgi:hypothetical protein